MIPLFVRRPKRHFPDVARTNRELLSVKTYQRRLLHVMEPRRRYSFSVFCLLISLTFSDARYTRQTKEYYLQTFKHPRKTPTNPPYCIYNSPHTPSPPKTPPDTPILQPPVVYPPPSTPPPPVHGGTMPGLWCVAKPTVPDPIIQEAMDYACSAGAECESILPGGSCYYPNTLLAHASFAFNSYWQRTKVAGGTCDFEGTAILITIDPSYGGCYFNII